MVANCLYSGDKLAHHLENPAVGIYFFGADLKSWMNLRRGVDGDDAFWSFGVERERGREGERGEGRGTGLV